jgi:hypothetical protein
VTIAAPAAAAATEATATTVAATTASDLAPTVLAAQTTPTTSQSAAKELSSQEWLAKRGTPEYFAFAMKLLRAPFSETPALERLWNEAAKGQPQTDEGYNAARRRFWRLVGRGTSVDAVLVRTVLQDAGYDVSGRRAPRSQLTWPTEVSPSELAKLEERDPYLAQKVRLLAARAREGRTPEGLQKQQRVESIEHEVSRHPDPSSPTYEEAMKYLNRFLDPHNLRLESLYENMLMGNKQ